MIDLPASIETLRAHIELESGLPTYSDYMYEPTDDDGVPDVENRKDILIYVDDENPWQFDDKESVFSIRIIFRFVLGKFDSTEYFETDAKNDAFNILQNLYGMMPGGIAMTHERSNCYHDNAKRHIINTLHKTFIQEV